MPLAVNGKARNKMSNNNNNGWCPVSSDTYLVSGTRRQTGDIGNPENFQIEREFTSSREAYTTARDESYTDGYEHVQVIAIKMVCTSCGQAHVVVPPDFYLYGKEPS